VLQYVVIALECEYVTVCRPEYFESSFTADWSMYVHMRDL
jgi:hypothetical protein